MARKDVEAQVSPSLSERFPPGTVRLEDTAGSHIVLSPQPTSDPNDPLNWSTLRKTIHMVLVSLYTMMAFAVICVGTPMWADLNMDINIDYDLLNDAYGLAAGTLCIGCVVFVPFALRWGRRPVYIFTAFLLTAVSIWSACVKTIGDWFGVNGVGGLAAAVNETLFQITVSDLFFVHQRGTMNGIYMIMVIIGNYIAPVISGYVTAAHGWRYVFWICTIIFGILSILNVFLLEETKYNLQSISGTPSDPEEVLSTEKLGTAKEKGPPQPVTSTPKPLLTPDTKSQDHRLFEIDHTIPLDSYSQRMKLYTPSPHISTPFWHHFYQPFIILYQFPAIAFSALQYGFTLAALSVVAVTQADVFPSAPYNFSSIGIGNLSLPPAIGGVLGCIYGGILVDYYIVWKTKRNGGIYELEMRLNMFLLPGVAMPAGLLLYGLTTAEIQLYSLFGYPWIVTCIGGGFVGFGIGGISDISVTYIQDSYKEILGDALVGVAFVRNIFGTILVFVISPMTDGMGLYNMFVLLGLLSFSISALYIPMMIWGKRSRVRCAALYKEFAATQYDSRKVN